MKIQAYESMAELDTKHFWYVSRLQIINSLIYKISNQGVHKVLDFGCGSGYISKGLQDRFPNLKITSADHNEIALKSVKSKGISDVLDLRVQALQESSYDIILCLDVLEHLENDQACLVKLKKSLKKNGKIIVTVPAFEFLWSGEDYVSNHLRRYNKKKLNNLIQKSGFRVEYISYFNFFLFLPILFVLFKNRILFPKSMYESNVKVYPDFLNLLFTKIFSFEEKFIGRIKFPIGFSLVAIISPEYFEEPNFEEKNDTV